VTCQELFLLIAFVGKVELPFQVAHPSHILKASDSMQKGAITQCLVPLQPSLLPHMADFLLSSQSASPVF
jgi:hypothetical protein